MHAFDKVFSAYYEMLVHFAFRSVASLDAAEDIVQEVFVQLWERRSTLHVRTSLRSYLFGATQHRILDRRAHEQVRDRHVAAVRDSEMLLGKSFDGAPDAALLASELSRRIERGIDALPPRTQAVFRLSRDAGLEYAEIASALGISVNTVYVLMGRALKVLREAVREEF